MYYFYFYKNKYITQDICIYQLLEGGPEPLYISVYVYIQTTIIFFGMAI